MAKLNLVENAINRLVPTEVNGKEGIPFKGVHKYTPQGKKQVQNIFSKSISS